MASPIVLRLTHPSNGTPCCRRLGHTGCQPVVLSLYPHPFPAITLSLYSALIVNQADDGGVVQSRPSAPTPTHTTILPWLLHDASRGRLNKLGSDGTRAAPTHAAHGCGSKVSLPMHVRILHVRGLMFEKSALRPVLVPEMPYKGGQDPSLQATMRFFDPKHLRARPLQLSILPRAYQKRKTPALPPRNQTPKFNMSGTRSSSVDALKDGYVLCCCPRCPAATPRAC